MDKARRQHLTTQLRHLRNKEARYGISVDPAILMQIEDIERELNESTPTSAAPAVTGATTLLTPLSPDAPPTIAERYRLSDPLGQGGSGTVYRAIDTRLGQEVAIKMLHAYADDTYRRAFAREAQLLSQIQHPAFPRVTDYFLTPAGQPVLVMDLIAGPDLAQVVQDQGPLPPQRWYAVAQKLCDAIAWLHAHTPPILHRDIKPANLKQRPDGQIVVLDFGLARGPAFTTRHVGQSVAGYTVAYAPLEQIQQQATDERSDLFALAATLWYLATGQEPVDVLTRLAAISQGAPDPLTAQAQPHQLPSGLVRGLSIHPQQRPATVQALLQSLVQTDASTPSVSPAPPPTYTLSTEDIQHQLKLLQTYRFNRSHHQHQLQALGPHAPPYVQAGINEAEQQIARIEGLLQSAGVDPTTMT